MILSKDKLVMLLFCILCVLSAVAGLHFVAARKIILAVALLGLGGAIVEQGKEKQSFRQTLVLGLIMVPIVIAGFFYKFAADLVLSYMALLFSAIFLFSCFTDVKQKYLGIAATVVFVAALVFAFMLNREAFTFLH